MIDIQQLTSLISAFRVETEYNIICFWKETKGSTFSSAASKGNRGGYFDVIIERLMAPKAKFV
jgi:hypothetical protein